MTPAATVIIPSFRHPAVLEPCLSALRSSRFPSDAYEIVVIEDGGPASLEAVATQYGAVHLRQPNQGPARARNAGAARAQGKLLLFLDDDCLPEPDWLPAMLRAAQHHPGALLGGRVINALPANLYSTASQSLLDAILDWTARHPRGPEAALAPFFPTNNLAVDRDRFLALGGFDERFVLAAAEDREFCWRWLFQGWPLQSVPDAVVRHAHRLSLPRFCRQHFNYGRGARQLRWTRAAQPGHGEPPAFYWHLFHWPWRQPDNQGQACCLSLLMALSQLATLAGALRESWAPAGPWKPLPRS